MPRVNLELPGVEVRFEDLHIETEAYAETGRQLPSLFNAVRSAVEVSTAHWEACAPLFCHHPVLKTLCNMMSNL